MSDHYKTILDQVLMALENLQALNDNDMELIHEIADKEQLEICARQLAKLAKPLESYRVDILGTSTHLGLLTGIKKNKYGQLSKYKIQNSQGSQWITVKEFKQRIKQQPPANIPAFNR